MRASATVWAIAVLDLHDLFLALGVATKAEMLAAGLDREAMIDHGSAALPVQEQRLNESYLLALWQLAARNTAVPHIGLLVGQTYNPSTRGVLASWLFHCDDLGEALRVFQRHIALMNPSESWMLDVDGDSLSLTISFAPGKAYPRAAVERSMTALTTWARELTGVPLVPTACEFAFSRPPYLASYTGIFGPNMGFDCDRNCIRLPQEILRRPIRSANSYLKQILEERARQALEKLEGESELIDKVRQRILSNLHLGLSIEEVCNALHVSRPTLYRRLKREGTVTRN